MIIKISLYCYNYERFPIMFNVLILLQTSKTIEVKVKTLLIPIC